jgi:flagellar biogenesis protein FliO
LIKKKQKNQDRIKLQPTKQNTTRYSALPASLVVEKILLNIIFAVTIILITTYLIQRIP